MKIVRENLNEFERGIDPQRTLGIGKKANLAKDLERENFSNRKTL